MPRVSDAIRQALADDRWDEPAQRAAVYADSAPLLLEACCEAYQAYNRSRVDPDGLKRAMAFCEDVARAVWKGLGYPANAGGPFPESIGLDDVRANQATERALKAPAPTADDSALYNVRA